MWSFAQGVKTASFAAKDKFLTLTITSGSKDIVDDPTRAKCHFNEI